MKRLLKKLWNDDRGVVTAEYLTLGSVVVLGGVAGLSSMSKSVNSEMEEFGNSVRAVRQTYAVPGSKGAGVAIPGSSAHNAPTHSRPIDADMVP